MGNRTFAAELEEAIAFAMTGVAELSGESSGIEMRAARAVVVDQAIIGELGTLEVVAGRQFTHHGKLEHHAQKRVRIRRATRNIDDRLVGDDRDPRRSRRWDSDPPRARRPRRRRSRWR